MSPKHEWLRFFDHHAPRYNDEAFTANTLAEVDFVIAELQLPAGGWLLDIGCGTGRHAVELAKRGYQVTGVDISEGMLAEARQAAQAAGVALDLIHADATRFTAARQYDGAVCLCEGAFSLLGMDDDPIEHDLAILRNVYCAQARRALLLTAINGMRVHPALQGRRRGGGRFDP
jgi:SAM-dependent methyltransferase